MVDGEVYSSMCLSSEHSLHIDHLLDMMPGDGSIYRTELRRTIDWKERLYF